MTWELHPVTQSHLNIESAIVKLPWGWGPARGVISEMQQLQDICCNSWQFSKLVVRIAPLKKLVTPGLELLSALLLARLIATVNTAWKPETDLSQITCKHCPGNQILPKFPQEGLLLLRCMATCTWAEVVGRRAWVRSHAWRGPVRNEVKGSGEAQSTYWTY